MDLLLHTGRRNDFLLLRAIPKCLGSGREELGLLQSVGEQDVLLAPL